MRDRTGQYIGNYQLVRLLGEGGFAEVYLGKHIHLDTLAAIKLLHTQLATPDIDQFRAEARTIAHLQHSNIVRVFDFGIQEKTPFLVMDYAPQGTLRQRYPRGSRLSPRVVVPYLKQVAAALQYAHNQRIIHRDIKPENLFLGQRGEVLLGDFGIALVAQSSLYQGGETMAGTVAYMAPEQIQLHPVPASDQYALAIVAYEWLAGQRPFDGTFTEIALKHTMTPPPSLRERVPSLTASIESVVFKALSKEPAQRFPSVQAFADALERALMDTPTLLTTGEDLAVQDAPTLLSSSSQIAEIQTQEHYVPTLRKDITPAPRGISNPGISLTPPLNIPEHTTAPDLRQGIPSQPGIGPGSFQHTPQTQNDPAHMPTVLTGSPQKSQRGLSRRALLGIGAGVTVGVLAAGGTTLALVRPDIFGLRPGDKDQNGIVTPTVAPTRSGSEARHTYRDHNTQVYTAAWSPDGVYIASGGQDNQVHVWNAATGHRPYAPYTNHKYSINALAWRPDREGERARVIASASADNTIQVWNALDGRQVALLDRHKATIRTLCWFPNGRMIASGDDSGTVYLWKVEENEVLAVSEEVGFRVWSVASSPNGKWLAWGGDDAIVHLWNVEKRVEERKYEKHRESRGQSKYIKSLAWSSDNARIASASDDFTIHVWGASPQSAVETVIYREHTLVLNGVAWSPNNKHIASGGGDQSVHVWDPHTGKSQFIYKGHSEAIHTVSWSPDGRHVASSSDDGTVQIWEAVPEGQPGG